MANHASRITHHASRVLVARLLAWFSSNARDLPWRRTRDPYAIWVSEIMLQQTQVKTVIPYWERWMRELPTIESVAKASPAKLHKLWEGLGYYTRVRNLKRAAQQIVASQSIRGRRGNESQTEAKLETPHVVSYKFPESYDEILALPGIGRYTAGAICSIAFNQPTPILDGNVIRVLTRVFGIATNPREKKTNAHLWQLAAELVTEAAGINSPRSSRRKEAHSENRQSAIGHRQFNQSLLTSAATVVGSCSALNQSLMELGALICTPRSPQCDVCPVQKLCVARRLNLQPQLPNLGKRAKTIDRRFIAFVVERDGKFLIRQRPAGVVNAHLWEFPNVEVGDAQGGACHSVRAAARVSQAGAQRTDAPYQPTKFHISAPKPLCTIKHSITRYRITLEAYRARLTNPHPPKGCRWLTLPQLHQLAFTSAHKKILRVVASEVGPRKSHRGKVSAD